MRFTLFLLSFLFSFAANCQTIGTVLLENEASEGFTLLHPSNFDTTYLINNCGERINQWASSLPNGSFAALKPNGNIVKSLRFAGDNFFTGGGRTGRFIEQDWSGATIWEYSLADSNYHLHHDAHILPNGNILAIAWERKSVSECIAAGRDSMNIPAEGLWPCVIFEIEPLGSFSSIVWEWHAWDHLVQEFDPTKANYGDLLVNKSRIDINKGNENNSPDWIHLNGIDYNEELDMVLLSSPMLNEIFIIDHSTTTSESGSNLGGNYGQGGDILWRWGNPVNYNAGNSSDQQLFFQHDAQWIDRGTTHKGMISVFSNQEQVNSTDVSIVKIIEFPFDSLSNNFPTLSDAYLPETTFFEFQLPDSLFSATTSGIEVQENDNLLIASGSKSTYLEINTSSQAVWSYLMPVKTNNQIATQGETGLSLKRIFQPTKYPSDFSGFVGQNMTPSSPIEQNPTPCLIASLDQMLATDAIKLFPNPASDYLLVESTYSEPLSARLYAANGIVVEKFDLKIGENNLEINHLPSGLYYLKVETNTYKIVLN